MSNNMFTNVSKDPASNVYTQVFGVDTSGINSGEVNLFGSAQDMLLIDVSGEGVISGVFTSGPYAGSTGFLTTRSIVKTFDLIAEGEIEGLSTGDFKWSGHVEEGQIGYESGSIVPYTNAPESWLRSIYLNDTPIVNSNNQYNFQSAQVAFTNGTPSGITSGDGFLNIDSERSVEKTRVINERLRGPDPNDQDDNPFYYHSKVYRFLNPELSELKVHIKIPTLTYTKIGGTNMAAAAGEQGSSEATFKESEWPVDELGQVRGSAIAFNYRYRPIEKDGYGNIDYSQSRKWYGMGGTGGNDDKPFFSSVKGLIRSAYIHDYTLRFDNDLKTDNVVGWEIEITRLTLDSIESHIVNQSYVDSITEVYQNALSYPNSAIASMTFNAEYFSQIPNRSYDVRLLKVKVPDNYDPLLRTYNPEPWTGNFKSERQWTDNPAWIFYDLITNKRYGLGRFLGDISVDKWTLYEISKFCDTLVSDGEGGYEPRFTCNVLINTREDAVKVLQDFASIFRSIVYYGYGNIYPAIDKPRDTIAQFVNANVSEGNFAYSSSSKKTLPTVCLVRYNDKRNFYKPAIEYVENTELIRKYGVVEKELTAFGCTSRAQALRLGRWILSTESEQKETVSFDTGPEAMLLRPGDIIKVTDTNRSETVLGGRAIAANQTGIAFDRIVELKPNTDYSLSLTTPTYFYDPSIVDIDSQTYYQDFRRSHVQTFDFNPSTTSNLSITTGALSSEDPNISGTHITLGGGSDMFSTTDKDILDQSVWSLGDISTKNTNLYSVISTKENDNLSYKVNALLHSTGKFTYIESGIYYSYVPSVSGIAVPPPTPHSVTLTNQEHPQSDSKQTRRIKIKINPCSSAPPSCDIGTTAGYKIYLKKGSTEWVDGTDTPSNSSVPNSEFYLETVYFSDYKENGEPVTFYLPPKNDDYAVRVFSVNSVGIISSSYKEAGISITNHFPIRDVNIHSLRLASSYVYNEVPGQGTVTKERFPSTNSKDVIVQWDTTFLNESIDVLPISYQIGIHVPNEGSSIAGSGINTYTTNDTIFNFNFQRNRDMATCSSCSNGYSRGPLRHFDLTVIAKDDDGNLSSGITSNGQQYGWDIIEVINPKPTGLYLTPRRSDGRRVALQTSDDEIWTDQFIDSDGLVHIDLLGNKLHDLAGGFAYVSKHPFSGEDFHANGQPKTVEERISEGRLSLSEIEGATAGKSGEYSISESHFQSPSGTSFGYQDAKITFNPDISGSFNPPYYLAAKFYDDFDREIYNNGTPLYDSWNSGLINLFNPNTPSAKQQSGLWLSFARDTTGTNNQFLSQRYCFSTGTCGQYVASPDEGHPTAFAAAGRPSWASNSNSTFATRISPTKYYSANQGGFKYWIRMNVNGQWEGQGISHVKVLTQKDVNTLYEYKGFYEYSCTMKERMFHDTYLGVQYTYWQPNADSSITRCRFRQTQLDSSDRAQSAWIDHTGLYFWGGQYSNGFPYYATTGATRNFLGGSFLEEELTRAGIAYTYDLHTKHPIQNEGDWNSNADSIASYNEKGQLITSISGYHANATIDRPLRGFRRFRVYFDENNLPEPSNPSGLASYAVVGLNCWNGEYESWPANNVNNVPPNTSHLEDSILFAKDGYNVFPSSVQSWLGKGDLFENIPGVWNHHPAGFGQGFGGLMKTQRYFDIHLGRMIDDSYLNEAFFGVVTTNDYSISDQVVRMPSAFAEQGLKDAVFSHNPYVTMTVADGGDGSGKWNDPKFI